MRRYLGLFVVVPLALATPARADVRYERFHLSESEYERVVSREHFRCIDESGGVTIHLRNCAAMELDRLDVRLNAAYRAAMDRMPTRAARLRLRNLERRWLAVRWDECRREARIHEGGTLALIQIDGCAINEVARRTAWLERYGR